MFIFGLASISALIVTLSSKINYASQKFSYQDITKKSEIAKLLIKWFMHQI